MRLPYVFFRPSRHVLCLSVFLSVLSCCARAVGAQCMADGPVADLIAITDQPLEEAARLLEAAGSVEAAVSLFFDGEAAADPAIEVAGAPQPPVEAGPMASSSAETSAAPRGTATATTWQAAATGDTFRRRLLVGLDAVRQLHENGLALPSAPIPSLTLA